MHDQDERKNVSASGVTARATKVVTAAVVDVADADVVVSGSACDRS